MKMTRKLLSLLLAVVLVIGSMATMVFAAPSKGASSIPKPVNKGGADSYIMTDLASGQDYSDLKADHADVLAAMEKFNSNHDANAFFDAIAGAKGGSAAAKALKGKYSFVTDIFDTDKTGENCYKENGKYCPIYNMSGIKTGKDMKLLHYSLEKGFEVLDVDQRSEGFAVLFDDLSPTAFLISSSESSAASTDSGKADGSKTSPKTDDSTSWMLWIGAAFVLAGASVVVMRRKEN